MTKRLLSLLLTGICLSTSAVAADIQINTANFPDANFRNYLLAQSYGTDGVLTDEEIKGVTKINVTDKGITNLKGVELFTALTVLDCSKNKLTALDVSKNTKLKQLHCNGNKLPVLNVTKNTALTKLICGSNQLTTIDVSMNTALTQLNCNNNHLTKVDVSSNKELATMNCAQNPITALDLSKNPKITGLSINRSNIKGANMDALISSLPRNTTSTLSKLWVINNSLNDEGNECTKTQVAALKAKGWTSLIYNKATKSWIEYVGSVIAPAQKQGDVDGDGKITKQDVTKLISHIIGFSPVTIGEDVADVNSDDRIDISDVTSIIGLMVDNKKEFRYFLDEDTGDEIFVTAIGDILVQRSNEKGGYTLQLCSFDEVSGMWSTEQCALAELDEDEHLCSFIFSDFSLYFTQNDDGKMNVAIIRHESGDNELLCQFDKPAFSRAFASNDRPSFTDRVATAKNTWGLIEEPIKSKLSSGELNKMKWAGNLWSFFLGKATGTVMEHVGNDFSTTIGNAVELLVQAGFNIALGSSAFADPLSAYLFLMKVVEEGRQHIINKQIGKDFTISDIETKRMTWNTYKAAYVVSGISSGAINTPEVDFIYYPRRNNVGWAVFPKTITHTCQNQAYTHDLTDLAPGPNTLQLEMYIEGFRILGPFLRRKKEFFVGLNSLSDAKVGKYDRKTGKIAQKILVYTANHNDAYPLADFGIYLRHDGNIQRYAHTEKVVENNSSGSGPSIGGVNSVVQELTIEVDEKDLVEVNSSEKKPKTDYYVGAYSYNFKTGEYEYYDEQVLDLKYSDIACPDANHPHWIDLGLPSGTQWRCCNEGASTPEAYGGYYTFGQVSSAPTLEQIKELLSNTTSVWTTQNGVAGRKFTGSNGGTIFLPAAGDRWEGEFSDVGDWGLYWSSTPYGEGYACGLSFGSDGAGWYYGSRPGYGRTVRPVR